MASATDIFGVDIDCTTDHGFVFGLTAGFTTLGNALIRRLITPRGGLWYDPDYGFDVRSYLNVALTRSKMGELIQGIEAECRKDDRVRDASAVATAVGFPDVDLRIVLQVTTAAGPTFPLVLSVAELAASGLPAAT